MTFPAVLSIDASQGSSSNTTSINISWPTTSDGDRLLLFWQNDGSGDFPVPPSGQWTDNAIIGANDGGHGHYVGWYDCDGTESGTFTFGITSGETCDIILVLLDAGTFDPDTDPEALAGTGSVTDTIDVGELTASWGSDDNLWIAFSARDAGSYAVTTWPLPDNQTTAGVNGDCAICTDELAQAALDPDAWVWSTSGSGSTAHIVVVRGASAGSTLTASGTPSIASLTASGTVTKFKRASSTATVAAVVASGVAAVISPPLTGSGTPAIETLTASGVATTSPKTITGTPALDGLIASGQATLGALGASGTPSLDEITASGAAFQTLRPSGTPEAPTVTAAGTAVKGALGLSGAPAIDALTASGNAFQVLRPSGTPSLDVLTATGAVSQTLMPSAVASIDALTASGSASLGGEGSFPSIVGIDATQGTASNVTSIDINWPSTNDGDRLLLFWQNDGSADTPSPPSGQWTDNEILNTNDGGHGYYFGYYDCDGTETGSFTFGISSAESCDVILMLLDAGTFNPGSAPEALAGTGSVTDAPDVGELTASWGSDKNLWIAWSARDTGSYAVSTWPLADNQTTAAVNGAEALCTDELEQAALDPDSWLWSTSGSGSTAHIIVVRGSGAPAALTASGTPSIEGPTASGTASLQGQLTASGTPSIPVLTPTGIVNNFEDAEGFPTLDVVVASGVAAKTAAPLTVSGTPSVTVLTASATASLSALTGSGTPSVDVLTASGSVIQTYMPSGSPSIEVLTSSGSVEIIGQLGASGTPSLDVVSASGAVTQTHKPSGAASIDVLTAFGIVVRSGEHLAYGTPVIDAITADGVARKITAATVVGSGGALVEISLFSGTVENSSMSGSVV